LVKHLQLCELVLTSTSIGAWVKFI
jgi:hypothetical protein